MDNYTVYMHRFPNGKVSIGITSQSPNERWRGGEGYKNQFVYRAIKKYGWGNIEHIVIISGLSKEEAEEKEIEMISSLMANNPEYGYNVENGGNCIGTHSKQTRDKISESNRRRFISEETRKRMSDAQKGKRMSEETKEKIRLAMTGRKMSDDNKRKLIEAHKGKPMSEEQKKKLSEAKKGKPVKFGNPEERGKKIGSKMEERNKKDPSILQRAKEAAVKKCSKAILQKCINGEEIAVWKSAAEIERVLKINHAQISRAARQIHSAMDICGNSYDF